MSDQAPDSPPRPQYGEYATPEEQRARIRQPDITTALETGSGVAGAPKPQAAAVPRGSSATDPAALTGTRPRMIDRIVTLALLAYGLVNLVTAIPALIDYVAYTDTVFQLLGVEVELSDPAAGRPWGIAAALVLAIGWLLTAIASWWNLRRGRITWWIPVVGALVFAFASGMLMLVPLMSDPAAWEVLVGSVR